jgi:MFS family permease
LAYLALLALGALDAAGYSVIAPVVPSIARTTGAGPALIGALVTCFAVGQLVGYPLAGRGIRRAHAAVVLALALVAMTVGDLGFILGHGLGVYLPSRLLQGVGAGGLWMGVTFGVLERFPHDAYRRLTGVLAAYSVGGIAGPALGGIGGIRGPFVAHLALVVAGGVVVALLGAPLAPPAFGSDRAILHSPGFRLASAGIVCVSLALGVLEGPLALHFGHRLSQKEISALYVAGSLLLGASAAVAGRLRPQLILALGTLLLTLTLPVAAASESIPLWVAMVLLAGIGFGIGEAGALGVLLETVGPERIVLAMVVWSQLWGIGYLTGPAAGGGIAQTLGFGGIGILSAAAALLVAAGFIATARTSAGATRSADWISR